MGLKLPVCPLALPLAQLRDHHVGDGNPFADREPLAAGVLVVLASVGEPVDAAGRKTGPKG
jgi:hypothetical protein